MMCLITYAAVVHEVGTLARLRISKILQVPFTAVQYAWEAPERGKYQMEFSVEEDEASGILDTQIIAVIRAVWEMDLKAELRQRLSTVRARRGPKVGLD